MRVFTWRLGGWGAFQGKGGREDHVGRLLRIGVRFSGPNRALVLRYSKCSIRGMAQGWSVEEVEATVADYFEMYGAQLRGERFNKSEHRRLLRRLVKRSDAAIEKKRQNISAVLVFERRIPHLAGYVPLPRYQHLLAEVVLGHLDANPDLVAAVEADAEAPVSVPAVEDILQALVAPPKATKKQKGPRSSGTNLPRHFPDYLAVEATRRERGKDGEEFALRFEKARLISVGLDRYVDSVEHVAAKPGGDGLGFDILSFGKQGEERFIEVKATKYSSHVPFYFSRGEREFSLRHRDQYHLYRVFDLEEDPHLFIKSCPLEVPYFEIEATQFQGRVA